MAGTTDDKTAPASTPKDVTSVDVESDAHSTDPEAQGVSRVSPDNAAAAVVDDHDGDLITAAEVQHLKRGLAERHLSMLGIAGAIGTGLFLSLGGAIQTGGPLGALLGYAMVGGIVCAVQFALGEATALLPVCLLAIAVSFASVWFSWLTDALPGYWKLCPSCGLSGRPCIGVCYWVEPGLREPA